MRSYLKNCNFSIQLTHSPSGSIVNYIYYHTGCLENVKTRLNGSSPKFNVAGAGLHALRAIAVADQYLGLPGQWFQLEHGLAYNWHRHYDPTTGRCTTADPPGFVDGPSVFAYAGNNPQRMVDPSGLDASYFSQITGAGSDFLRNYSDMRSANTIGADKYFHCKANCEASQRGDAGREVARILSNGREFLDQCFGGSQAASSADQFANLIGRVNGSMSGRSCRNLCSAVRPRMLKSSY